MVNRTAAIRARAPLRISFAGGGTDVPPYPETAGGCVLSATIDFYAYASLIPGGNRDEFEVESPDLGTVFRMQSRARATSPDSRALLGATNIAGNAIPDAARPNDFFVSTSRTSSSVDSPAPGIRASRSTGWRGGVSSDRCELVKAVLDEFPQHREQLRHGRLVLHSDAPPGSGLGSSSALIVAMTATLAEKTGEALGPYEIAARAAKIERENMEVPGGYQDHYAAAFGGFNFIEFDVEGALVHPLALRAETVDELHASLVLCYTGKTRISGHILQRQIQAYEAKEERSVEALERIKQIAIEMRSALLKGRLSDFAEGLSAGWEAKKQLAEGITEDDIDALYEFGLDNGAVAGKVLGAGGGGYFLFFCPVEKAARLRAALEERGNRVMPFSFERRGVQTWRAPYF
ncbi:MAG: GHMP kinase [Acidimicrobiia bacterium]